MLFTTFIKLSKLIVKHLEVFTFHGSTIHNNILGLDFSSVVMHCSLNIQMAKMSGVKIHLNIFYLTQITDKYLQNKTVYGPCFRILQLTCIHVVISINLMTLSRSL